MVFYRVNVLSIGTFNSHLLEVHNVFCVILRPLLNPFKDLNNIFCEQCLFYARHYANLSVNGFQSWKVYFVCNKFLFLLGTNKKLLNPLP